MKKMCIRDRILPVINKIDLPAADPERVRTEVEDVIGLDASEAVLASAKAGIGIEEILEQIVEKVPAPTGDVAAPLQALIFDSVYDPYRGVILQVRVVNGMVKPGDTIQLMSNGKTFDVTEVGIFTPKAVGRDFLATGDVGYIAASIKTVADTRVGDTVTLATNPAAEPLHGYKQMNPMVFAGLYPCLLYTSSLVLFVERTRHQTGVTGPCWLIEDLQTNLEGFYKSLNV